MIGNDSFQRKKIRYKFQSKMFYWLYILYAKTISIK